MFIVDFVGRFIAQHEHEKLLLTLTESARGKFKALTKERSEHGEGGHLAILVDGEMVSAPIVRREIDTESIEISGDIAKDKTDKIIAAINSSPKNSI